MDRKMNDDGWIYEGWLDGWRDRQTDRQMEHFKLPFLILKPFGQLRLRVTDPSLSAAENTMPHLNVTLNSDSNAPRLSS